MNIFILHVVSVVHSFWLRKGVKKDPFFGRSFPNVFTHPRVFVRFGNTKGEFSFVQNL